MVQNSGVERGRRLIPVPLGVMVLFVLLRVVIFCAGNLGPIGVSYIGTSFKSVLPIVTFAALRDLVMRTTPPIRRPRAPPKKPVPPRGGIVTERVCCLRM